MDAVTGFFRLVFDIRLDFQSLYELFDCSINSVAPRCSEVTARVEFVDRFIPGFWGELEWLSFALAGFTLAFIVINGLVVATVLHTWFERRMLGRFQTRLGPNRWGPFGLFQPIADGIKFFTKEDTVPEDADWLVFLLAPIVLLVPAFMVFAVIPLGDDSFLGRLNIGVLFIVAVTGVNTFGIFMGGWASRNKYAMFGAMRAVAMLISYEIPMALAITGIVITSGSLALNDIVTAQALPYILVQPLAFLIFITAASAEISRAPFDMIEAESELGGGYHTEYSGVKFSIFQLAEFMAPIAAATVATVLFLGGTRGYEPVPGQVWFLLKVVLLVFFLLWMRATWPRLRVDQIMVFAWKGLFPLSLLNVFLIAIEVQVFQDATGKLSTDALWVMAAINWLTTIVSIVVIANVLGQPKLKRPTPVPSPLANMSAEAD